MTVAPVDGAMPLTFGAGDQPAGFPDHQAGDYVTDAEHRVVVGRLAVATARRHRRRRHQHCPSSPGWLDFSRHTRHRPPRHRRETPSTRRRSRAPACRRRSPWSASTACECRSCAWRWAAPAIAHRHQGERRRLPTGKSIQPTSTFSKSKTALKFEVMSTGLFSKPLPVSRRSTEDPPGAGVIFAYCRKLGVGGQLGTETKDV